MREFRRLLTPDGSVLVDNFRPLQSVGDRVVQLSATGFTQSPSSTKSSASGPSWSYAGDTGRVDK